NEGIKISGRYSSHPGYEYIDLGKIMNEFGGGGHKGAASSRMCIEDFKDKFLPYIKIQNLDLIN
ncbi:MAG: hypothetical protein ACOC1K_06030, partial [Nanoarchaeota archaeon]